MNKIIHSCCCNDPKFLISYKHGGMYKVCKSCIDLPEWFLGIKLKKVLK